jgi:hypothetical protein
MIVGFTTKAGVAFLFCAQERGYAARYIPHRDLEKLSECSLRGHHYVTLQTP